MSEDRRIAFFVARDGTLPGPLPKWGENKETLINATKAVSLYR